jgi:hypothetical protein
MSDDQASRLQRQDMKPHSFVGLGEREFAHRCAEHGIEFSYEPYLYQLVIEEGVDDQGHSYVQTLRAFTPDFLIHATHDAPAVHVELTSGRHFRGKISSIQRTRELHGVHTTLLLVGSTKWHRIMRDSAKFERLIEQTRHRGRKLARDPRIVQAA